MMAGAASGDGGDRFAGPRYVVTLPLAQAAVMSFPPGCPVLIPYRGELPSESWTTTATISSAVVTLGTVESIFVDLRPAGRRELMHRIRVPSDNNNHNHHDVVMVGETALRYAPQCPVWVRPEALWAASASADTTSPRPPADLLLGTVLYGRRREDDDDVGRSPVYYSVLLQAGCTQYRDVHGIAQQFLQFRPPPPPPSNHDKRDGANERQRQPMLDLSSSSSTRAVKQEEQPPPTEQHQQRHEHGTDNSSHRKQQEHQETTTTPNHDDNVNNSDMEDSDDPHTDDEQLMPSGSATTERNSTLHHNENNSKHTRGEPSEHHHNSSLDHSMIRRIPVPEWVPDTSSVAGRLCRHLAQLKQQTKYEYTLQVLGKGARYQELHPPPAMYRDRLYILIEPSTQSAAANRKGLAKAVSLAEDLVSRYCGQGPDSVAAATRMTPGEMPPSDDTTSNTSTGMCTPRDRATHGRERRHKKPRRQDQATLDSEFRFVVHAGHGHPRDEDDDKTAASKIVCRASVSTVGPLDPSRWVPPPSKFSNHALPPPAAEPRRPGTPPGSS